ncbi:MAG: tyrosine-type recombinase/integrase [Proteobacteria bacterium]|nr:tyrosine-type recombinase/integrase [Pseudomonadota bacterium]
MVNLRRAPTRPRYPVLNSLAIGFLKEQKQYSFLMGKEIFLNPHTGKPFFSNKSQRTIWTQCLKELEIPHLRSYTTRHSFASQLINADPSLIYEVSKALGHSNIEITKKFYLSETKDQNVLAQQGIEAVLAKAAQNKKETA